jgi:hypothetical protein
MEDPQAKRRARITAIMIGSSVVICLLFLMYAFVQRESAAKASHEAMAARDMAYKNAGLAGLQAQEAENHKRAMQQQIDQCGKESAKKDSIILALKSKRNRL